MATAEQKEQLVERLKFKPITVSLTLWGYGGEYATGKLTEEQYNYWKDKEESDIVMHCTNWDEDSPEQKAIPEEAKFVEDASWYETKGQLDHMSGVEFDDHCHITVSTADIVPASDKAEIFDEPLGFHLEEDFGVQIDSSAESYANEKEDVDYYFWMCSAEKGTFFQGQFLLREPFDPSKLKITTCDFEGVDIVTDVEYDGELIEGYDGYDTTGKGYYANINKVE
jgi:hypothetical protein